MKAVTIKQPFASLIVHGIKKFEYRTWRTKYRGDILIHAGASTVKDQLYRLDNTDIIIENSRVVGKVTITDCVLITDENSEYYGLYAWCLEDPVIIKSDVVVKGKLSFFEIEEY